MKIIEFLLARLDEDEHAARYALTRGDGGAVDFTGQWFGAVKHAERWGPGRVLAECEAKRVVLNRALANYSEAIAAGVSKTEADEWPMPDLWTLATVHANHPDYDESWRP